MIHGKRVLVLTPQLPYPPQQGTAIRNYNLIAQLAKRHTLHLLSFQQAGDTLADDSPLLRLCARLETVPAPSRTLSRRLLALISSSLPDMALRLASPALERRLEAFLLQESYDVVQIEGIEMAPYALWLRGWPRFASLDPRPLLVFDDHNAEYVLQRRVFETDIRRPGRWAGAVYSLIQWQKLRRYEALVCRLVDRVAAVSPADAAALRRLAPGLEPAVVPNGVDLESYRVAPSPGEGPAMAMPPMSLVFTGKMDFRPNVDAVLWFAGEVLPLIRQARPGAHFYVVGKGRHARLDALRQRDDVTLTGWVEDIRPYIARSAVCVVPLRMGGGTRLKVLEAMAMGKAIVSTSLGCEGFEVTDGRELRMADTPEAFAARVVELLDDEGRRADLGRAGRRFVEARYGWEAIVPEIERLYEPDRDQVRRNRGHGAGS